MLRTLYRSAAAWLALGLIAGVYYREFARFNDFTGHTQLSTVHTHALALGVLFPLILLALTSLFDLEAHGRLRGAVLLYNIALIGVVGIMIVKGSAQVLGAAWADHAAVSGVSGLTHIALTVAFIWLFVILGKGVKARQTTASVANR